MTPGATLLATLAAEDGERRSQPVTDWAERIGWVIGLLLLVALVYWLMRQGWKWRATLQSDLPEPEPLPGEPGAPRLSFTGRYHGSTVAGQWLERIVAHGLGVRSRADVALTERGVTVARPGAGDFLIPAEHVLGARLDKGIAGKVLTEGGLLVITWRLGERVLDSGFRSDLASEHAAWVEALGHHHPNPPADAARPSQTNEPEGAR
ncbi:hypothetical protein [Streptomyces sedi]|uniref:PH domain-containing protein n=1 Tax=Streptomyces sedi TaxID=555059 RepID=A0A5C4UV70_9ACTN|nr:hypothetical protein [Streptomyces sedi]TNM27477.1 hypothetical protein FH715_20730 [Streptomyces sedi]